MIEIDELFFSVMSYRSSRSQMFLKIDVLRNFHKKAPVLESLFNEVADEVFKNMFFYRTPPVAVFVFFATKQLNIQCYNDNFGLYYNQKLSQKYCNYYHPTFIKISISYQKYAHLSQNFVVFPTFSSQVQTWSTQAFISV